MRAHPVVALLAVLLLGGCTLGGRPETHPVASHPAGISTELLTTTNRTLKGELVAAEDSSLVLLVDAHLIRVSHLRVRRITFANFRRTYGGGDWRRELLYPDKYEAIRMRSRYPQGLTPELEARLVSAYGGAIEEIN